MSSEPKSVAASNTLTSHGPVSPPSAAEHLFLSHLPTKDISAFELASSLRRNVSSGSSLNRPGRRRSKSPQSATTAASDYHTAVGEEESQVLDSDIDEIPEIVEDELDVSQHPSGKPESLEQAKEKVATKSCQAEETAEVVTSVQGGEAEDSVSREIPASSETVAENKEIQKKKSLELEISEGERIISKEVVTSKEVLVKSPHEANKPLETSAVKTETLSVAVSVVSSENPSGDKVKETKALTIEKVTEEKEPAVVISRSALEATMAKQTDKTTATKPVTTTKTEEKKEADHFEVSQQVYEQAKNLWGFGKGIFLVKTFLNTAEAVASKVLEVKGLKLTDVDNGLKPKLAELDNGLLDPAIAKVAGLILPIYQKTEAAIIKPIVVQVVPRLLKNPLAILKGDSKSSEPKKEGGKTVIIV